MNHIFRVHGHTILKEENAARAFDGVGLGSVVPRTVRKQVTLSASQSVMVM